MCNKQIDNIPVNVFLQKKLIDFFRLLLFESSEEELGMVLCCMLVLGNVPHAVVSTF